MTEYWIKLYHEILDDPTMATMPDRIWRRTIELFLICGMKKTNGYLPKINKIASILQLDIELIEKDLSKLISLGIISKTESGYKLANRFLISSVIHATSNRPNPDVWNYLRSQIFIRDNFTCQYCGARNTRLECDHIIPVSRGGSSEESNLTTACFECNRSKRDKLIEEWKN